MDIDQAVYGYDDGHRLISSSCEIGRTDQQLLQSLTDLSGPIASGKYEEYYSFFPLSSGSDFAFCKTWYAGEMRRPGSVWTHTLFIRKPFVDLNESLTELSLNFCRPTRETASRATSAIKFTNFKLLSESFEMTLSPSDLGYEDCISSMFLEVFKSPATPIIISSDSPADYLLPLMRIWGILTGPLKRDFSFCTGALSARKINGLPFAIQVAPTDRSRLLQRKIDRSIVLSGQEKKPGASYYSRAILERGSYSAFKSNVVFISEIIDIHGDDYPLIYAAGASSLGVGVDSARGVPNIISIPGLATEQSYRYCLMRFMLMIKKMEFTPDLTENFSHIINQSVAVRNDNKWREVLENSVSQIVVINSEVAISMVRVSANATDPTGLVVDVVRAICLTLPDGAILSIMEQVPRMVPWLITLRPNLACQDQTWRIHGIDVDAAVDVLLSADSSKPELPSVLDSMLSGQWKPSLLRIADRLGKAGCIAILRHLGSKNFPFQNQRMLEYLMENYNVFKEYVEVESALPVIVYTRYIHISRIMRMDISPRAFEEMLNSVSVFGQAKVPAKELLCLCALAYGSAIVHIDAGYSRVAALAFVPLYAAAMNDEMPNEAWDIIADKLPRLQPWNMWDKCERLRRSYVDIYAEREWPINDFLYAISKSPYFNAISEYAIERHPDYFKDRLGES